MHASSPIKHSTCLIVAVGAFSDAGALVSLFLYFLDTEKAGRRAPSPRFGLCLSTFFFVLYSLVFRDLVVFPLVEFCREQGQLTYFCVSARSRFGLSPPPSELKPGEGGGVEGNGISLVWPTFFRGLPPVVSYWRAECHARCLLIGTASAGPCGGACCGKRLQQCLRPLCQNSKIVEV